MNKKVTSTVFAIALLAGTTPAWAEETPNQTSATMGTQTEMNVTATAGTNTDTATQTAGATSSVSTTSTHATSVETVNPESFLYKLKDLINQFKVWFTFDDKEKADLLIQQASTKIDELASLNQTNQTEYNQKLIETINQTLEKAQEILKEAKVEAEDKQDHTAKAVIEEKEESAVQTEKHSLVVLKSLLGQVPEQGKKGIENAIAKQESKLNIRLKSVQQVSEPNQNSSAAIQGTTGTSAATEQQTTVQTGINGTAEQPSAPSSSATQQAAAEVNVQTPVFEGSLQIKHDNGLHLGQIKQQERQEKQQKHQEKQPEK